MEIAQGHGCLYAASGTSSLFISYFLVCHGFHWGQTEGLRVE